jgi:MFS family permease
MLAGLREVLGRRQPWVIACFAACMAGPMFAFSGLWGVPYLMRVHDLERPAAALTASAMMVGWALGAPAAGWISDHLGRRRAPMIGGAVVALLAMATLLYVPQVPLTGIVALLFLNGFAGGSMSVCFAAAREHSPRHATGVAIGFVNMINIAAGHFTSR